MKQIILTSFVLFFSVSIFASNNIRQEFVDEMNSIADKVKDISLADLYNSPGPVFEVSSRRSARYLDIRNSDYRACSFSQPQTEGDGIIRQMFLKGKRPQVIAGQPFLSDDFCSTIRNEEFNFMGEKISREQYRSIVEGMSFVTRPDNLQKIGNKVSSLSVLSTAGARLSPHKDFRISYSSATKEHLYYQIDFSVFTFSTTRNPFLAQCTLNVLVQLNDARDFTGIKFAVPSIGCGNLPYY